MNRACGINNGIAHATAALRQLGHFASTFQVPSCLPEF